MLNIIFAVSLFSISLMITVKRLEIRRQKAILFSQSRARADERVSRTGLKAVKFFSFFSEKNAKLFAAFAAESLLLAFKGIKRKSEAKKMKFFESLRNGGNPKRGGSASFFLKNVSEYKKSAK